MPAGTAGKGTFLAAQEASISASVRGSLLAALEGIEEGAVAAGLSADTARAFAGQALEGSVMLMVQQGGSPAMLKDRVASPGGTTIAGLEALEAGAVRGSMMRTVVTTANGVDEESRK